MAGHSHWAGIKHRKALVDARRGRLFSKLAKAIIAAARQGGGDPATNLPLRYAIDAAKAANMPKENIARAIKRGTGEIQGETLEELVYEGYGPGGVAILVEALTDNRNRTSMELKTLFTKKGGRLAGAGSTAWKFELKAYFEVPADRVDEDTLLAVVLEAGGDDVQREGDTFQVTAPPGAFEALKQAFAAKGIPTDTAQITRLPTATTRIEDPATAKKVLALMEALEDHDDVKQAYADFDIPERLLAAEG